MDPVDVEYKIIDVLDMHGTIIIRARDVNTNVEVSMNVNSNSFHSMTEDDINHMIVDAIYRETIAQERTKVAQGVGDDNLSKLKALMVTKQTTKLHPAIRNKEVPK